MKDRMSLFTALLVTALFALGNGFVLAEKAPPAKETEQCGTIQGIACADGLWCDLREGNCKGRDLDGVCVKPADACTEDYQPVCGCKGKTYSNDCQRIKAKAQKSHAGECKGTRNQTKPGGGM